MKIYTKTGDDGTTGLFGGKRVLKDDERVDTYGEIDELNSIIGLSRAFVLSNDVNKDLEKFRINSLILVHIWRHQLKIE